jgi:lysyl endopeptidase
MKIIILAVLIAICFAQLHVEVEPYSFKHKVNTKTSTVVLPLLNHQELLEEDEIEKMDPTKDVATRFSVPQKVSINLRNSGEWQTLADGSRLWRLTVVTKGAFSTQLIFDKYNLPKGASLHVIGNKNSATPYIGAFNERNNPANGEVFATGPLSGDSFTLEYFEPKSVSGKGELQIENVMHAYRNYFGEEEKNGRSGLCNFNVVCPLGNNWRNQIRSVAALTTGSGGRFCTASLMNNLENDKKQYLLTANHCGASSTGWVILFNYQSITCERGGNRFLNYTVARVSEVFRNTPSDHNLVLIGEPIPKTYNVYYNGWSAVNEPERNYTVGIHHPAGDVKKISFSYFPTSSSNWGGGPANTHWRVPQWSNGTTEPGSSGSPLFDSNKRVVGQLHGGSASCRVVVGGWDAYGKIAVSYDAGLKKFIDPKNTGKRLCDGFDASTNKVDYLSQ